MAAAAAVLAVLLSWPAAAEGRSAGEPRGVRMYHHSFDRTLTYDDTLGDWLTSGATMALRDRVQLMPPVRDRHGLLFAKKPAETQDFEVRFTISATDNGEAGDALHDGVVVFWLGLDDFAASYNETAIVQSPGKDWAEGLASVGHTLLGNKPNFRGLAMTFAGTGKAKNVKQQTVAGVWNDGRVKLGRQDLLDVSSGANRKAVNWMTAGTQVKVRVSRDGSVSGAVMTLDLQRHLAGSLWGWAADGVNSDGMLTFEQNGKVVWNDGKPQGSWHVLPANKLQLTFNDETHVLRFEGSHRAEQEEPAQATPSALLYGGKDFGAVEEDWTEVFKLPSGTFPLHGTEAFLGFTGWTGQKHYIEVDLHRMEVTNFDANTAGEDVTDLLASDSGAWLKVLEEEKRYVDQASQTEAVNRLLKLLTDHVDRYDQQGERMRSDLVRMEERLDLLGSDVSTYLSAMQAFSWEASKFNSSSVKDHIVGVRAAILKNTNAQRSKVDQVAMKAKELKNLHSAEAVSPASSSKIKTVAEQAKAVEDFAAAGSMQANVMLLLIVVAVAGLGILFLNRMNYYEKKHYI